MADPFFSLNDLGLSGSSSQLLAEWLDDMQAQYPGYVPSAANLEYVQAQIFSQFAADLASLCSEGATELFRVYASTLVGLPYLQGVAAQAVITITANASPGTIATTTQLLSVGGPIVDITVVALPFGIAAGTITLTDPTGAHTQTWTTSGASAGATAISVTSQVPNFAYPVGSTITGTQTYVVPALTQFALDTLGFVNLAEVDINAGSAANVTLTAVLAGTAFNGAGSQGSVQSIQQLTWVSSFSVLSSASGGVDPEDDTHYINRAKVELQLQAPRPITATDFATMALNFTPYPGTDQQEVGRATSLDGYNPVDQSTGNTRMVAVAVTDANGLPLNNDTLYGYPNGSSSNVITTTPSVEAGWGIAGWLQSLREITFIVNVIQPTYVPVYVTATVKATAGYDTVSVQTNVQAALLAYLNPLAWGLPPSNTQASESGWVNTVTIFQSALMAIVQQSSGVQYVVDGTLKFGLAGSPSNTLDLTLTGVIPLPTSDTTTIALAAITVI
jgi:hypothetical protein